ncbi:VOC family protein [Paenibacillus sp.]|uniref:VOC family protein n=1 Tax=Paenibacillus sp. TaxID=58172 RepID=UPI002D402F44|nr:VOC family protein [Paenibacillus sp.]HZG88043.1 VOC family protein [Paenibacillus sp.]
MEEQIIATESPGPAGVVPKLLYDGGSIDILYDYHEDAIKWYENHLGWKVEQKENWKPDPRVAAGKMTHMGRGYWLTSYVTKKKLPFHYAERGTIDPHVRLCLKAKDIKQTHDDFSKKGIRVSEIYNGPGGHSYFDAWLTMEGTRFTFQDELEHSPIAFPDCDNFRDTCVRIGVKNLENAIKWYKQYVGMEVESLHGGDGYAIMSLGVNHHPNGKSMWVLEQLSDGAITEKVDGPVRPTCYIQNREQFFGYHTFLKNSGVDVCEIGGFTGRGMSMFHFYDPDGNRFNVSCFV